ncbi:molybdenum cofactor cytidylyltransferase [Cyclobacterium lianum]|uniref:Molybdenum cofactor cytidylyltransferase n=1 Tax=Cyclobacterium lianum TaxID=388280 RepID=A0A1M7MM79_9BACT|nr:nucleotidyltransferase family protein [Cyclobacterium lianum]SHM92023.1 molybdenum cofactor cytidylyltransferase [Cyclobacterium lianum]
MIQTAAIILSAGNSSRLGTPKQLLSYEGQTLIERAIATAKTAGCDPIIVVTGAFRKEIEAIIRNLEVEIVKNHDWEQGMGNSISMGISVLQKISQAKQAIVMLSDQPLVPAKHLETLIQTKSRGTKDIVASLYKTRLGVPALFDQNCFALLRGLKGPEGARKMIGSQKDNTESVLFENGKVDIDTREDYHALLAGDLDHFD